MTRTVHICIITSSNIFENSIGGEAKYALSLHNWLIQNRMKSTLLGNQLFKIISYDSYTFNKKSKSNGSIQSKNSLFRFYLFFMGYRFVVSFLMAIRIFRLHQKNPFSLIHAQDTGYSGLTAVTIGKLLGIPVVISSHGVRHKTIQESLNSKIKNTIVRIEKSIDTFTTKRADEVLSDNNTINDYMSKLSGRHVDTLPIPIDLEVFKFSKSNRELIRKELGIEDKDKIIGYVGRFAPEKNLLTLIAAVAKLVSKHSEIRLMLVGDGPMILELKNYVQTLNISDKVIFYGVRQDVNRILSGFDIFVLPSLIEGMSVALLEAMATGCPIVCSKISTNEELVSHGKDGILVDPNSIEDFEGSILQILEDDKLRNNLKNNAVIKANHYGISEVFHKLLSSYQETIEKHYKHKINRNI